MHAKTTLEGGTAVMPCQSEIPPVGRQLIAYAIGPSYPSFPGSSGVTVSAWEIHLSTGELVERLMIPSAFADRHQWLATIRAIRGVCESPLVDPGDTIRILIRIEPLVVCLKNGFVNSDGSLAKNHAEGVLLMELIRERQLNVTLEYVPKVPKDQTFKALKADARAGAIEQCKRLGSLAQTTALLSCHQRPGPFQSVGGYVDRPAPIRRLDKPSRTLS